jgi:hypothetical protein
VPYWRTISDFTPASNPSIFHPQFGQRGNGLTSLCKLRQRRCAMVVCWNTRPGRDLRLRIRPLCNNNRVPGMDAQCSDGQILPGPKPSAVNPERARRDGQPDIPQAGSPHKMRKRYCYTTAHLRRARHRPALPVLRPLRRRPVLKAQWCCRRNHNQQKFLRLRDGQVRQSGVHRVQGRTRPRWYWAEANFGSPPPTPSLAESRRCCRTLRR